MLLRPGPVPKRKKAHYTGERATRPAQGTPKLYSNCSQLTGKCTDGHVQQKARQRNVYESGRTQAGPLQTLELAWALMWHQKANTTKSLTGELSAPELRLDIGNKGSQGIKIVPSQLLYLIACRNFRRLSFLHLQFSLGKKKMMTSRNPPDAAKARLALSLCKFDTILSGVIIFLRTPQ